MKESDWLDAFRQVIDEQIVAALVLSERLADEARVLLESDLDGLDSVTAAKQESIAALERVEAERRSLMGMLAGSTRQAGHEEVLRNLDGSGHATERWNHLTALLEACRERNAQNGRLVALRRAQVVRSLSILAGGPRGGLTYGPHGTATQAIPRRDLARG